MKIKLLLIPALCFGMSASAQYAKWLEAYPSAGEYTQQQELVVSPTEHLAFAGTAITSNSSHAVYLHKADSMGTILWSDNMPLVNPQFNGDSYLRASALAFDMSDNLFLAMNFSDTLQVGSSTYPTTTSAPRTMLIKYTPAGVKDFLQVWDNSAIYGLAMDNANNMSVMMSFSGTMSFFGQTFTASGDSDLLIATINSSNTVVFSKVIHGGKMGGTELRRSPSGNYVVLANFMDTIHYDGVGHTWSHDGTPDAVVMKISPSGAVLGYDNAISTIMEYEDDIVVAADERVAMSGHGSWTYNSWGILKTYSPVITETSSQILSDDDYSSVHDISSLTVADPAGFWGLGFTLIANIEGDPEDDQFFWLLYKHDFAGNLIKKDSFEFFSFPFDWRAKHIAAGANGNFYITAPLNGTITMQGHTATSSGTGDGFFIAKFNEDPGITTGVAETQDSRHFKVFPNPSAASLFISSDLIGATLQVFDVCGRLVHSRQVTTAQTELKDLPAGVYTIRLSDGSQQLTERAVITK